MAYLLVTIGCHEDASTVWMPWIGPDDLDPTEVVNDFFKCLQGLYTKDNPSDKGDHYTECPGCKRKIEEKPNFCSNCGLSLRLADTSLGERVSTWFVDFLWACELHKTAYFEDVDWEPCDMGEVFTEPGQVILIDNFDEFLISFIDEEDFKFEFKENSNPLRLSLY